MTGPWDCTRQDRRLVLEGWEGFYAVKEGDFWALYFDREGDGLRGKVGAGTPVVGVELVRAEMRVPRPIVEPTEGEKEGAGGGGGEGGIEKLRAQAELVREALRRLKAQAEEEERTAAEGEGQPAKDAAERAATLRAQEEVLRDALGEIEASTGGKPDGMEEPRGSPEGQQTEDPRKQKPESPPRTNRERPPTKNITSEGSPAQSLDRQSGGKTRPPANLTFAEPKGNGSSNGTRNLNSSRNSKPKGRRNRGASGTSPLRSTSRSDGTAPFTDSQTSPDRRSATNGRKSANPHKRGENKKADETENRNGNGKSGKGTMGEKGRTNGASAGS